MPAFRAFLLIVLVPLGAAESQGRYQATPVDLAGSTLGGRLRAPPGFQVTEFAKVLGARFMAVGPDGAVYVSQPRSGQVTRLADVDGDGTAESQGVAVEGLNRRMASPSGMAGCTSRTPTAWCADWRRRRATALRRSSTNTRRAAGTGRGPSCSAPTGRCMTIGSSCNLCEERTPDRAAVMRHDADGRNGRVSRWPATRWDRPASRDARDLGHAARAGQLRPDHGPAARGDQYPEGGCELRWPYCHSDRVPNPEYNDAARCAGTEPPAWACRRTRRR